MKNTTFLAAAAGVVGLSSSFLYAQSTTTTTNEIVRVSAQGDIRSNNYVFHVGLSNDPNSEVFIPQISWDIQHDFARREGKSIRVVSPARMKIFVVGMGFGPVSNPFVVRTDFRINNQGWQELHYRDPSPSTVANEPNPSTPYVDTVVSPGDVINFRAKGWNNNGRNNMPSDSDWWTAIPQDDIPGVRSYRTRFTDSNPYNMPDENVQLLQRGETVGSWTPAFDQGPVGEFLEQYIDPNTNRVIIGERDFIYLFELSETNPRPDMQDAVIVVEFEPLVVTNDGEVVDAQLPNVTTR